MRTMVSPCFKMFCSSASRLPLVFASSISSWSIKICAASRSTTIWLFSGLGTLPMNIAAMLVSCMTMVANTDDKYSSRETSFSMLALLAWPLDLRHQVMNQAFEPRLEFDGFENGLAFLRSLEQRTRNQISHLVGIGEALKVIEHVLHGIIIGAFAFLPGLFEHRGRKRRRAILDALPNEFMHLGQERVDHHAVVLLGLKRPNDLDAIRLGLDGFAQFHARNPLQDK